MNSSRALSVVGWGAFCAVSWTWCIGMFLPLIMLNRFGWAGFVVFAVPNVIGCAGFGFVIRHRARSEQMISQHGVAATWFSVVTIAYHMFFAVYLCSELLVHADESQRASVSGALASLHVAGFDALLLPLAAVTALSLGALLMSRMSDGAMLLCAGAVYLLSLGVFGALIPTSGAAVPFSSGSAADLAFVAPVIIFGFLLCPYLDLTFHRALQKSAHRASFAIFGVLFALMIVLTCVMWTRSDLAIWMQWMIIAHVAAQAMATVALHMREIAHQTAIACRKRKYVLIRMPSVAAVLYLLLYLLFDQPRIGEGMYLRFLGFYGLIFPLYVWAFMSPWAVAMSRPNLLRFAGAIALCAPLYELGFVHERYWVLLIPACAFIMWPAVRAATAAKQQRAIA